MWNQVMLWQLAPTAWLQGSWLGRSAGSLRAWGQASWLVNCLDLLGLGLCALLLLLTGQPSTGLIGGVLLLVAIVAIAQWLTESPALSPVHWPLGLYWAIVTLATFLSPVQRAALDGWLKLTLYLLAFLLFHRLLALPRPRQILITTLLLVSLGVSIYGLRQYFYGAAELASWVDPASGLAGTVRVYSYLRNPNLFAGYLVPILPLSLVALWVWPHWGSKLLALLVTAFNGVCLLFTYSRGGWLGALGMGAVLAILLVQWNQIYLPKRWRRWALPTLIGGSVVLAIAAFLFVEPLRLRVLSMFAGRGDSSNNFRINVWLSVIDMIRDYPWLGIGPGNVAFNRVYPLYQRPNFNALGAYSVPLELTLETGLIGALAYLWFLVVLLGQGWRRWQQLLVTRQPSALWLAAGLAAVVGVMTHGLVDTVYYRPQIQLLWWFGVALITSSLVEAPANAANQLALQPPLAAKNPPLS